MQSQGFQCVFSTNKKIFNIVVETEKNVSLACFLYNDLKGVEQRFFYFLVHLQAKGDIRRV